MENNLWSDFAQCSKDLLFDRDIDIMIFDRGDTIMCGYQIEDRDLRGWTKF